MPRRREILAPGELYHVYNRGVEKRPIFEHQREYERFIESLKFYQRAHRHRFSLLSQNERLEVIQKKEGQKLVEIICYCLMPNHFHLMLKQLDDRGISRFLQVISDSYSRYFNILHNRVGSLFQGKFKAVRIEDNNQLLQVSRYIHLNPVTSFLSEKPEDYRWSSYPEYLGTPGFCDKEVVFGQFRTTSSYKKFIKDQADYQRKLVRIEHLVLEELT